MSSGESVRLLADHGVSGSNPSGASFVHLEMGDAKEPSPKKFQV